MIALCFRRVQSSTHRSAEEKPVLGAPESTRNFFGNDDLVNIRNAKVLVRGDRLDRAIQRRREFQASSQASFQGESILASDWPQVRAAPQDLRSSGIGDCCYLPTLFDVQNAGASEWATPELFTIALIASEASHHQFANRPQKLHVVDNRIFRRVLGGGILIRTRARRFSPRRHYRETLFGGICATVRNQIRSQSS